MRMRWPFMAKKNDDLAAGRALGGGLDDLGEERGGNLLEMGGGDGGAGAPLGKGADVCHVAEEHLEGHGGRDDARPRLVFHRLHAAAAAVDVADQVALIFLGRRDLDAHDRLEEDRGRLLHRILEGENARHLERELGRIDLVERPVDDADDDIDDRVPGDRAVVAAFHVSGDRRLYEFLRYRAADNLVEHLDALALAVRLEGDAHMAVLALAARLADELSP